jgi:hypothetical protein
MDIVLYMYAASRNVAGLSPHEVTEIFFNLPNPSSRTMPLGFTLPLTEMSTVRPALEADNITAICKPIV